MKSIQRALIATSLLGSVAAQAGTEPPTDPGAAEVTGSSSTATGLLLGKFPGETDFDKIWSAFTLYKDDNNPILQSFALQGRLQLQTISGRANGDSYTTSDYKDKLGKDEAVWGNDVEVRRAYLGFKSVWFQNWKLEGQIDVDTDGRDGAGTGDNTFYKDIYDLYAIYAPSDAMNVGIGKQEIKITREQEISSKDIVTLERSFAANMVHPGNLSGVWIQGKGIAEHWLYEAGIYGNDQQREFTTFDAGALYLAKVGYDYSSQAGLDSAAVVLRYTHNDSPGYASKTLVNWDGTGFKTPAFSDVIDLSNEITNGRFGLTTDVIYGVGYTGSAEQNGATVAVDQSDIFAIDIIPTYYVAPGLQLVTRFSFASANSGDGLKLGSRYEQVANSSDQKGNTYTSEYLGLNWYIYGNKLKVMSGVEFSQLGGGDYDGYTIETGLRMSF